MKKIALLLCTAFALTACGEAQQNTTTVAPTVSSATPATASEVSSNLPVYKVAVEKQFTPFVVPGKGIEVEGFERDILQAIGEKQGFQVKFDVYAWDDVLPKLNDGGADIAGSGIIMTPERLQTWTFTEPFIQTGFAVVVRQDSPIKSTEDLKKASIAVQPNSTFAEFAQSQSSNIIPTKSPWDSIREVMMGKADAAMANGVIASHYVGEFPKENLRFVNVGSEKINIGFALKKDNIELKQKIDKGLAQIKADGTYDKIKAKWHIQ